MRKEILPERITELNIKSKNLWVLKPSFFDSPQSINIQQKTPRKNTISMSLTLADPIFTTSGIIF